MAGGLYQTSYISAGDLPVWMGHAKDDATVSYNCAPGLNNPLVVTLCGTGKMMPKLDSVGVKYDSMILETGGHTWPSLGNSGKDFKNAITEIAAFFYPMIPGNTNTSSATMGKQGITIYPNPATNQIFIQSKNNAQLGNFQLVNAIGQTLYFGTQNDLSSTINIEHLPKGVYKIIWDNHQITAQTLVFQ